MICAVILLFSLNNSKTVKAVTPGNGKAVTVTAFSNILLETFVPNLVSITCPMLQILGKPQTGVFPISAFLVNPL